MRRLAACLLLLIAAAFPAAAQTYYDIDVDLPQYPEMEPVEDLPVYYAPAVNSTDFYYDGLYWDYYHDGYHDGWYASTWYNGPWAYVDPVYVPTYILWIPIRYYHKPPAFWRNWNAHGRPRWGERWGADWQSRHNAVYGQHRGPAPARAPLPVYQRNFNRGNYPRAVQQQTAIHTQQYAYQPRENIVRQQYQMRGVNVQGAPKGRAPEGDKSPAPQRGSAESPGSCSARWPCSSSTRALSRC